MRKENLGASQLRKPSSDHTVIISEAAKSLFASRGLLEHNKSQLQALPLFLQDSGDRQGQSSFLLGCVSKIFFSVIFKRQKKEARASPLSWGNHFHPTSPGMLSGCWRSTATQGQIQGMHLIYLTETSSSDLWSLTQLDMGWGAVLKTSLRRWLSSTRQFENHWFPHKKAGTQGLR